MTAKELEADEGGYVYRYRYMGSEGRTAVGTGGVCRAGTYPKCPAPMLAKAPQMHPNQRTQKCSI